MSRVVRKLVFGVSYQGPTQTGGNISKVLISCTCYHAAVLPMQLICSFVFAYAKCGFLMMQPTFSIYFIFWSLHVHVYGVGLFIILLHYIQP